MIQLIRKTRRWPLLIALAALGCAFLGASAVSADKQESAKGQVLGVQDCAKPKVKPDRIIFTCADAGIYANNIFWRSWGGRKARASSAILHAPNDAGESVEYYAKLALHKVKTRTCDGKTGRYYTRVRLKFPWEAPGYANRIPTKLFCV